VWILLISFIAYSSFRWLIQQNTRRWKKWNVVTFISRLMHSNTQNLELKSTLYKSLRHKFKNHSYMFRISWDPSSGSTEPHLTEITPYVSHAFIVCVHTRHRFKITLPNTDLAHDKCMWTIRNNFSQVRLCTPWWWVSRDPKHVGVTFKFVCFKILYNVDFNV
jgi:hypothetical protein